MFGASKPSAFAFPPKDPVSPSQLWEDSISIPVPTVSEGSVPVPPVCVPKHVQQALTTSLTSGIFIDTRFYLFSKRHSSGRVSHPRPLYANSHVLKAISHFEILLSHGFREEVKSDLRAGFPEDQDNYTEDYDYLSDSDLESVADEEEEDIPQGSDPSADHMISPKTTDSDGIQFAPAEQIIEAVDGRSQENDKPTLNQDVKGLQLWSAPDHLGNVVIVKDAAFSTFKALLLYLHTGVIRLSPIGSRNKRGRTSVSPSFEASPKSIYRLADKYDIGDLKQIAFNDICTKIFWFDIVDETFSRFTSRYDEIRAVELQLLRTYLLSPNTAAITDSLMTVVRSYTNGNIPHCSETFIALFNALSSKTSPEPAPMLKTNKIGLYDWFSNEALKVSLAESLTTGVFLDTRFYATSSRRYPYTKAPIYFSRTAVDSLFVNIEKYITRIDIELVDGVAVCNSEPGDCEVDSDLDEEEPDECTAEHEKGVSTVAISYDLTHPDLYAPKDKIFISADVAKLGAVSTWKAALFYSYTRGVTFAPLTSQGVEARKDKTLYPHRPKPCSPKSLYSLADKLGISRLQGLAFKDIGSKLNEFNILTELFSKFTSSHKDILTMESEFLQNTLDNAGDANMVLDHIRSMAGGNLLHGADALMSIFLRLVDKLKAEVAAEDKLKAEVAAEAKKREVLGSSSLQPRISKKGVGRYY